MHRIVLTTLLVVMAVPALAQDAAPPTPRFDLYVGVGNVRTVGGGHASDYHSTRPVVKFGWNISRRMGLVFDGSFAVASLKGVTRVEYSVTAGPRFAFVNGSRLVPFVQVVAGVNRDQKSTAISPVTYDACLAAQVAAGGGLDVVVNHRWAVRALQVEGRKILVSGAASELVISAGVVLRFGSAPHSK
jgi:hypothetical protein